MGQQEVGAFVNVVNNSPELMRKCQDALEGSEDPSAFVSLAKENGHDFTEDDARSFFSETFAASRPTEMSDDELERVAGGKGGGTIMPEDNVNALQSSVNMLGSMDFRRPPRWTGFRF